MGTKRRIGSRNLTKRVHNTLLCSVPLPRTNRTGKEMWIPDCATDVYYLPKKIRESVKGTRHKCLITSLEIIRVSRINVVH